MDFGFIFDNRIREIVERDYAELQNLDPLRAIKSVITLSGSIIEALLFDALVASGKWTFEKACENNLKDMMNVAYATKLIMEDRLTNATRNSRNLIHPGREVRDNVMFDQSDAQAAKVAVDIVIRDVRRWAALEMQRRNFKTYLNKLSADQIEFLQLFGLPKPPESDEYEHPFLPHSRYSSISSLIDNGVLMKEQTEELSDSEQRIRLNPEVIELLEELVIKRKIQRDSIVLHHRNIGGSGAGGSGAPPYTSRRR
jgi:hypothetical protein